MTITVADLFCGAEACSIDDPARLLAELAATRDRLDDARRARRLLLAYAREFHPSGLSLRKLGAAAGMTAEGVRHAYQADDVTAVASALGVAVPAKRRDDT